MALKVISEHFDTIYGFLKTSKDRKNNIAMEGEHSSTESGDDTWYGTKSYSEAEDLFRNGYTSILKDVLDGIKENEKLHHELTNTPKMIPRNQVVGYAPHVPNSIIGIPESMIYTERSIHKQKTIDITYSAGVNSYVSADDMKKAGITLLSAIKIIETMGIYINLDLAAFITEAGGEIANPTISLKKYHERLDIQKLCFPLAHPSMLRRFGFKWLETNPYITSTAYRGGYGHALENPDEIKQKLQFGEKMHVLNANWIIDHKFNVSDVIKYLRDEFK